jgi:hypothetical protein
LRGWFALVLLHDAGPGKKSLADDGSL